MKIIFVCTGNTCRSPMAEGYLKSKMLKNVTVLSRGLFADGSKVSVNSKTVMEEMGIDIKDHISRTLDVNDMDADLFIPMSVSHKETLIALGIKEEKILTFNNDIPDPYGLNLTVYRYCRDKIISGIDELLFDGKIVPFTVSEAKFSDIKDIEKLEKECFSSPWSEDALIESFSAGTKFFVCKQKEKTLGYVGISCVAGEGYITNIAVTKDYRKCGVATLLLNRLLTISFKMPLEFLTLEVRTSNKQAQNLYNKFSFKTEGRRKNFYTFPNEDALIMTRRFKNVDTQY